jgi:hypothetical protein
MSFASVALLGVLAIASVGDTVAAQIGSLNLPSSPLRSLHVLPGGYVVAAAVAGGVQFYVDVSNPTAPVVATIVDPPFGDQWFEAEYTPDFGGRLFTGHRFGGLNMLDVSNPLAPTVAATDPQAIYHYRGLRYRNFGGQSLLYYGETNWGLAVYAVGANSLTRVWTDFANATSDANGMEVVGNHLYLFGCPFVQPGRRELKTYDLSTPAVPVQVDLNTDWLVAAPAQGHCQLRATGLGSHLLAARHADGLDLVDLADPAAPVPTPLVPPIPGVHVWGSYSMPGATESIVYGVLVVGVVRTPWWFSFHVLPGFGILPINGGVAPIEVFDMAADPATGRLFVLGRDAATLQGRLLVY